MTYIHAACMIHAYEPLLGSMTKELAYFSWRTCILCVTWKDHHIFKENEGPSDRFEGPGPIRILSELQKVRVRETMLKDLPPRALLPTNHKIGLRCMLEVYGMHTHWVALDAPPGLQRRVHTYVR